MTNKEYASLIASIHNKLFDINVKGDDVFRMADVLQICRSIVDECTGGDSQAQPINEE